MGKFDKLKGVGESLKGAGGVARAIETTRTVAETAAEEAKLTNRKGEVSKLRVVKAVATPRKTGARLVSGVVRGVEAASTARGTDQNHKALRSGVICPICDEPGADQPAHWESHTFEIETGEGIGRYTWACSCGPADGFWPSLSNAAAGLALHLKQQHGVSTF